MTVPAVPGTPRPARVRASHGAPAVVDGQRVEALLEDWLVQDRWWTEAPIHRRYWEVVTNSGRRLVVFHDIEDDRWYRQAA